MRNKVQRWGTGLLCFIAVVVAWEVFSRTGALPSLIPAPSTIVGQIWQDRANYSIHIIATLESAGVAFIVGNVIAAVIAVIVRLFPIFQPSLGIFTFVYSIPLILLVPMIGMLFSPELTKFITAMLLVFYPTLLITTVAIDTVPEPLVNVILGAGGSAWTVFRKARLRYAVDGLVVGLQTTAPYAILGAMLGEFTGARWGLGAYLIAIMAQAQPAKEWGIFVVCSALAGAAYLVVGVVLKPLGAIRAKGKVEHYSGGISAAVPKAAKWPIKVSLFVAVLSVWQLAARLLDLPYFVKGPIELLRYAANLSPEEWSAFAMALMETLEWAGLGLIVALSSAFLFAIFLDLIPSLGSAFLPFALVSQCVPIVAIIPLYVALLGRGVAMTVAVVVSATFFPSFATIYEGLRQTPEYLIDVVRSAGGKQRSVLWTAKLPNALPFLYAAARLAAPRVLLGVTLAEYLATRRGFGALMFEARGRMDFALMSWIALATGAVSMLFYWTVRSLEARFSNKYGDATTSRAI